MTDGPAFYQRGNFQVPQWTNATRGPGLPGAVGFNTQTGNLECWDGSEWTAVGSGGGGGATGATGPTGPAGPTGATGPSGGGGGSLLPATVTLSSAQILASHSSPVQAIAGVGGKTIFVMGADFVYNHVTTDYTGSGSVTLVYHGDSSAPLASSGVQWGQWSSSNNWGQTPNGFVNNSTLSAATRVGLGVDVFTPIADPTGGDSTMTITVWYVTF